MSRIVFRLIGVFVLLALLATAGTFIYRAGIADGISQAPQVAQALENNSPMMYGNPYHHGFGFGFGLFPIFGIFLFLFFFFGLLRLIFFRGWSHHNKHGHWSKHWEGGTPPMFDEWHKKAHGEESAEVNK